MARENPSRRKAANDNRHDQHGWELVHKYAHWFIEWYRIPVSKWHYNRATHYAYELFNRPWLSFEKRRDDVIKWFDAEKRDMDFYTGDFAGCD